MRHKMDILASIDLWVVSIWSPAIQMRLIIADKAYLSFQRLGCVSSRRVCKSVDKIFKAIYVIWMDVYLVCLMEPWNTYVFLLVYGSFCNDEMVVRPSYLHNGNSKTWKYGLSIATAPCFSTGTFELSSKILTEFANVNSASTLDVSDKKQPLPENWLQAFIIS